MVIKNYEELPIKNRLKVQYVEIYYIQFSPAVSANSVRTSPKQHLQVRGRRNAKGIAFVTLDGRGSQVVEVRYCRDEE